MLTLKLLLEVLQSGAVGGIAKLFDTLSGFDRLLIVRKWLLTLGRTLNLFDTAKVMLILVTVRHQVPTSPS